MKLHILLGALSLLVLPTIAAADDCPAATQVVGWGNVITNVPWVVNADRDCAGVEVIALPNVGKQNTSFVQGEYDVYGAMEFVPQVLAQTDVRPQLFAPMAARTTYMLMANNPPENDADLAAFLAGKTIAGIRCGLEGAYSPELMSMSDFPPIGNQQLVEWLSRVAPEASVSCGETALPDTIHIQPFARSSNRTTALLNGEVEIAMIAYHQHFRLADQGFEVLAWPHDFAPAFMTAINIDSARTNEVAAAASAVAEDWRYRTTWMQENVSVAAEQLVDVALETGYRGQLSGMVVRTDQQVDEAETLARMTTFVEYGLEHLWRSSACFDETALQNTGAMYLIDDVRSLLAPDACVE